MSKEVKYIVLSPFSSNGKVFTRHGAIVSSNDLSEHDIKRLEQGKYIKVVEEPKKEESQLDKYNSFKKKRKRI